MNDTLNPRGLSDAAVFELVKQDMCPACITGELDTGYECNNCGFDAIEISKRMAELGLIR